MSWRGLILGVAGLAFLELAVSNPKAYGRLGGFAAGFGGLLTKFMDPTVPALTTNATSTAASVPSASPTTPTTQTIPQGSVLA